MSQTGSIKKCQTCGNSAWKPVLSLGHQPIVQDYLTRERLHEPEVHYPLNLMFCPRCSLVQLDYIADPKKVFPADYPYRTGLTNMLIRNFESLADTLQKRAAFEAGDLVIDIGSNDGSLLKPFKKRGARVLGIEPTNAAKVANRAGIPTIQKYFDGDTARLVLKKNGKARLITATNVFAHILDPNALTRNIASLMDQDSLFVSESQYLADIVENMEFDTIYHEHLRFYTIKSLMSLFKRNGLSIVDAEKISAAGGSIRVYTKKGNLPMSVRAKKILAQERKSGLHDIEHLRVFAKKALVARNALLSLILTTKKTSTLSALGSPARSNTLLNFAHIDASLIDRAYEKDGSPKIGLFAPGSHIPVASESSLVTDKPDVLLVLSWHIGEELIAIMRKKGYRGAFLMPLPKPRIIRAV